LFGRLRPFRTGDLHVRGMPNAVPFCSSYKTGGEMLANVLIALVAALHLYFMYLEMVAWDTPAGHRAFGLTPEFAKASKVLAANQGLYNGFLAAGLIWGLYLGEAGFTIKIFFLICVMAAGLFGAATVSRKILYVQAVPAVLALGALLLV
jgi:putative membrane protein